ncbi:MAG: hypothetical protein JKY54_03440 [Flavobacteriales bacterium]|nr:hypothetical protein [Flavobacteriales bacterium]
MKRTLLVAALVVPISIGFAQNLKRETVKFKYTQLPSDPVDKTITNFQGEVIVLAEAEALAKQEAAAAANADALAMYQQELSVWDGQCEIARKQYADEMEVWNSKSLVWQKLNKENKPRLRLPYKPSPRHTSVTYSGPKYDKAMLRDTYLNLEGFNQDPTNALKYTIKIYDWFETHQLKNKEMVRRKDGVSTKYYVYEYTGEYKLPISLKVETPDGKILYNKMVPGTETNTKWTSKSYNSRSQLTSAVNIAATVENKQQTCLQQNLEFVNNFCNDMFGFPIREESTTSFTVKSKKVDYTDFDNAAEAFKTALQNMLTEEDISGFETAIGIWDGAIIENAAAGKKGRLKKKNLLMGTIFSIVEAKMWQGKYEEAIAATKRIDGHKPSKGDENQAKAYVERINDMIQRQKANG